VNELLRGGLGFVSQSLREIILGTKCARFLTTKKYRAVSFFRVQKNTKVLFATTEEFF
jgi:hypothetical protein